MSHVRAKFRCWEVAERALSDWDLSRGNDANVGVKLHPVSGDPIFGKATPSGNIDMTIMNRKAADAFKPGQEYYVDFTPVPEEPEPAKDIRTI